MRFYLCVLVLLVSALRAQSSDPQNDFWHDIPSSPLKFDIPAKDPGLRRNATSSNPLTHGSSDRLRSGLGHRIRRCCLRQSSRAKLEAHFEGRGSVLSSALSSHHSHPMCPAGPTIGGRESAVRRWGIMAASDPPSCRYSEISAN